jgi:hypothetical protein
MGFSAFVITITSTDFRTDRSCGVAQSFVIYTLEVVNGAQSWICEKRYSDFLALDEVLPNRTFTAANADFFCKAIRTSFPD